MIFKEFQDLVDKTGSRYGLVIAVTKRARAIKDGDRQLAGSPDEKAVSVAIKEMVEGKVEIVNNKKSEN